MNKFFLLIIFFLFFIFIFLYNQNKVKEFRESGSILNKVKLTEDIIKPNFFSLGTEYHIIVGDGIDICLYYPGKYGPYLLKGDFIDITKNGIIKTNSFGEEKAIEFCDDFDRNVFFK